MEDWRRIDIDALDPDNRLTAEDLIPEVQPVSLQEVQQTTTAIRSHLSSGQFAQAIAAGVSNPPYGADERTKDLVSSAIFEVLISVKQSEINGVIKQLSLEQQDNLIKYLYKNMSTPTGQRQGGVLLNWFDKTVEITGLGPIARYLSDRRTV